METLLPLAGVGLESVATVGVAAMVGAYARRSGLLSEPAQKVMDKLVSSVFLPCLIVAKVTPHCTITDLAMIWPLILVCVLLVLYGLGAGAFIAGLGGRLSGKREAFARYRGLLMVAVAFPNSFSVPMTLLFALGPHPVLMVDEPGGPEVLHDRIHLLFLLSYSVWVLARWGIGFPILSGVTSLKDWWLKMLNPPVIACLFAAVVGATVKALPFSLPNPLVRPVATGIEYAGRCTVPVILMALGARVDEAVVDVLAGWRAARTRRAGGLPAPAVDLEDGADGVPEPATKAELEGLAEGLALEEISLEMPDVTGQPNPSAVGDTKAQTAEKQVSMPAVAYLAVLIMRQILGPVIVAALVCGVLRNMLGVQRRVVLMVAMLQGAGPPMINLGVMAGLSGNAEREAAKLILLTYGASVVTWTASIALFLLLLDRPTR